MRKILFHFVRVIAILLFAAYAIWFTHYNWIQGNKILSIVTFVTAIFAVFQFRRWLYSGRFQQKSFIQYIARYRKWKFFKREIILYLIFIPLGIIISATIGIFTKHTNLFLNAEFWILSAFIVLIIILSKMTAGYIKYCYKRD